MSSFGYTNELQIPDLDREIASLRKRVEELERRAIRLTDDPPAFGCCTSYCCNESPFQDRTTGQIGDYCAIDPDPIGGAGMRLDVSGWIKFTVNSSGFTSVRIWIDVDGTEYVGSPQSSETRTANDVFTLPYGGTIDSAVPDPTVTVRVQNLGTPTIRVLQVYRSLWVAGQDGSTACGEPAGQ